MSNLYTELGKKRAFWDVPVYNLTRHLTLDDGFNCFNSHWNSLWPKFHHEYAIQVRIAQIAPHLRPQYKHSIY